MRVDFVSSQLCSADFHDNLSQYKSSAIPLSSAKVTLDHGLDETTTTMVVSALLLNVVRTLIHCRSGRCP